MTAAGSTQPIAAVEIPACGHPSSGRTSLPMAGSIARMSGVVRISNTLANAILVHASGRRSARSRAVSTGN
jgi:hypothetical protein